MELESKAIARLLIEKDRLPGRTLMAGDDVLANPAEQRSEPVQTTLRFYCWDPSAVSLGVHQASETVDWSRCSSYGWDVVRRPTGGRALLHDGDLSYSVTISGGSQSPDRLKVLYEAVASAWIVTLAKFGIKADLVRGGRSDYGPSNILISQSRLRDGLCLDSRVRGELVVGTRKITTAAQRIYSNTILQHGSFSLMGDVGSIADVLPVNEATRIIARQKLRNSATTIGDEANRDIFPQELIEAALGPFSDCLNLQLVSDHWRDYELEQIAEREPFHAVHTLERYDSVAMDV